MTMLRATLIANSVSCLGFGFLFLMFPRDVSDFVGLEHSRLLLLVGSLLVVNGLHLLRAARRETLHFLEIAYFSAGDLLWFTATLYLVAGNWLITTAHGALAALTVAIFVATLGVLQLSVAPHRHILNERNPKDHLPPHLSTKKALTASWLSMKIWVKLWLFFLNGVFLVAIVFGPNPSAKFILAGYVASGPWLLAIMIAQKGLTRFLSVAHLAAWLPLSVILFLQVPMARGSEQIFLIVFSAVIVACLVMDAYDLWRWQTGEKFRLGSKNAAKSGASGEAGVKKTQ